MPRSLSPHLLLDFLQLSYGFRRMHRSFLLSGRRTA